MKITNLEVANLLFTYPPGKEFNYAGGCCTGRLSSLIRVTTDSGTEGIGSVYSNPELVRVIVEHQLRDLLVGEDPLEVESIWEKSCRVTRWYGPKGAAMSALGGVDIALWDIRGKAAGQPIYQLLGARHDAVPAYASGLCGDPFGSRRSRISGNRAQSRRWRDLDEPQHGRSGCQCAPTFHRSIGDER